MTNRVLGSRCWVLANSSTVCDKYARTQHPGPKTRSYGYYR
jgi:hypothetical protein